MALQGTIDAFPLTDVLTLLASSHKTGRLVLEGDRGSAAVWIDDGRVTGGDVVGAGTGTTAASLLFEMLRFEDGAFVFDDPEPGASSTVEVEPASIATSLEQANELLDQWSEIARVVPSLAHRLVLVDELPDDEIRLDRSDWALVLAAANDPTIAAVGDRLGLDEFGVCAAAAELVGRGLAAMDEPAPSRELARIDLSVTNDEPVAEERGEDPSSSRPADDEPAAELEREPDTEPEPEPELEPVGFPDRFPIDDLVGGGAEDEDDPWSSPEMEQLEARRMAAAQDFDHVGFEGLPPLERVPLADAGGPSSTVADAWDEIAEDAERADAMAAADDGAADDSTDEVLRQMSKLSPQAAEAIAAALNSVPAGAPAEEEHRDEGGSDGPISFSGMF